MHAGNMYKGFPLYSIWLGEGDYCCSLALMKPGVVR